MYYLMVENNEIIGASQAESGGDIIDIEVTEEVYNAFLDDRNRYIWDGSKIIENPNYEAEKAQKREIEFHKEFFNTSLGYIRRSVTMKDGSHKDFLSDLLPAIKSGLEIGQEVTILTYDEPDYSEDVTDWEIYQHKKLANAQFIGECLQQVVKDFAG